MTTPVSYEPTPADLSAMLTGLVMIVGLYWLGLRWLRRRFRP